MNSDTSNLNASANIATARRLPLTLKEWSVLVILVALPFSLMLLGPKYAANVETRNSSGVLIQLAVIEDHVQRTYAQMWLAGMALVFVPVTMLFAKRRILGGSICAIALPLLGLWIGLRAYAPDVVALFPQETITTPAGTQYAYLVGGGLQGHPFALGQFKKSDGRYTTWDILCEMPIAWEIASYGIVRPVSNSGPRELYLSPGGQLVCLMSSNDCFLIYDLNTNTPYSEESGRSMSAWSPFLLIDANAIPDSIDVADINRRIAAGSQPFRDAPTATALNPDLNHPNPSARAATTQMLRAMDQKPVGK